MHLNGIRCSALCVMLHYVNNNLYLIQKYMFWVFNYCPQKEKIIGAFGASGISLQAKLAGMQDQQSVQMWHQTINKQVIHKVVSSKSKNQILCKFCIQNSAIQKYCSSVGSTKCAINIICDP